MCSDSISAFGDVFIFSHFVPVSLKLRPCLENISKLKIVMPCQEHGKPTGGDIAQEMLTYQEPTNNNTLQTSLWDKIYFVGPHINT